MNFTPRTVQNCHTYRSRKKDAKLNCMTLLETIRVFGIRDRSELSPKWNEVPCKITTVTSLLLKEFKQRLKDVLDVGEGSPKTNYKNLCVKNLIVIQTIFSLFYTLVCITLVIYCLCYFKVDTEQN